MVDPSVYDREYFLSHCEGYNEFQQGTISSRLRKAANCLSGSRSLRILDVGCGRGELVQYLAKMGHSCDGIDYSKDAVEIAGKSARENLSGEEVRNCCFHLANAERMDFDDDTFDVGFMLDVVEHLYPMELERALREVRRVLKPGGRLIIHTVPNKWVIKPARLAMRVLRIPSEEVRHVNEQSVFSLKKGILPFFTGRIRIERERGFWSFWVKSSNRTSSRIIISSLRALDFLLDNRIVSPLIDLPPFVFYFGTDIWGDLTVRK